MNIGLVQSAMHCVS